MKVTPELKRLLEEAAGEVAKWPKWKRSLDPIGDEGRENVQRAPAGTGQGQTGDYSNIVRARRAVTKDFCLEVVDR